MNPHESFRRRHLPHWDVPGATYFVTACLHGSIPAQGLLDVQGYAAELDRRPRPAGMSEDGWRTHKWKLTFARTEDWLDRRPGVRHLADSRLAEVVVDAVYHFAGERYDLLAHVVMPSHLHWVFRPLESWADSLPRGPNERTPRERIMHGLKRHTGLVCNRLLGQEGAFWQGESYDHWVRDGDELGRIIHYVEGNPVKAGLVQSPAEWPFSSAKDRATWGGELGCPLRRGTGVARDS